MKSLLLSLILAALLTAQDADLVAAKKLHAEHKWREAGLALDKWCAQHPADADAQRLAAEAWMRLHRFDRGAARLRNALAVRPGDPGLLFDLGICLQNQARWSEAMPIWRELLALAASDSKIDLLPQIPHALGICALRLDLTSDAIDALSRAVDMAPDNVGFRRELAGTLFEADRFAQAMQHYQTLLAQHPGSAEYLYFAGLAALRNGDDTRAESYLRDARRADAKGAGPSLKLAQLYQRIGKSELAHSMYLEALERNALSSEALHGLQRIAQVRGDSEDAKEYQRRFEEVKRTEDAGSERLRTLLRRLKTNPQDIDALLEQASMHLQERKFDRAMECYALVLSNHPTHDIAALNMAALLAQRGEAFAALCELDRVLESDPGQPFANLERCRLLLLGRDFSNASVAARAALGRMDRKDARFLDLLEMLGESALQQRIAADVPEILSGAVAEAPPERTARLALRALQLWSLNGEGAKARAVLELAAGKIPVTDPLRTPLLQQLVRLADERGDGQDAERWRALLDAKD